MPYRGLFRMPGVGAQAVFGFLSQLTQQVAPVGMVLVVQAATGSLALAGTCAAAFSVGAGMGRPVQGRLMDRRGPRAVLTATAFLHVAGLIALVAAAAGGWPAWTFVALGWVAGAGLPPISVSMRVEWGRQVGDDARTAVYSLVYLVQELAMLVGPLLFGLVIAAASSSLALGVVAVAAGAGTLAFSRALRADGTAPVREGGRVFADRGMLVLLAVVLLLGGTMGALQVGVPAMAAARDVPAATGLLVAALSLGGIAGAAGYGARTWASPPAGRLVGLLLVLGVVLAPLAMVGALPAFWAMLFAGGLVLNPALTTSSLLVDRFAPGAQGEAFGWLSTAMGMGAAAGSGVAGVAGQWSGASAPFLVSAASALLGALLAVPLLGRRKA
ncbi:MFS transporter [Nonomuraea sp. NPDC051191]|uniref:MFS transporter n=1 Tax=Nonomuraea sp. NPDC051191 TaxID=3364372 RepID=UPI0037AF3D93